MQRKQGNGLALEAQFTQEETEAGHDKADGDGGQPGANPGQKGALVGQMVGNLRAGAPARVGGGLLWFVWLF
ncbi:hypothetical protein KDH_73400 [Dictyobacter sp. S3.2.2.5]|uniref:Uncharacterized protein n=1 Tax=Dictyobacter halimunensis TaxID=3026934 RepID=A0ABQ6G1X2_9CHLR|nr:hypothetical protein KDH_73400 [Dictyobacter sp. S3.2.2.5]